MTEASVEPIKAPRLKFIDMARSIAILMMLEGLQKELGVILQISVSKKDSVEY